MSERHSQIVPPVGGSSLLTVFAVLCLTTFAVLSLATVQADRRTADAAEDAVCGYYQADTQAEKILARLRCGEQPEGVSRTGQTYSYSVPVSDTQELCVKVWISKADYQILQWQTASAADWEPDDSLQVWDGK